MKKMHLCLLLLAYVIIGCNGGDNKSPGETKIQTNEVTALKTISMEVKGMTCEGCEHTIESALTDIDGVVSVEASHQKAVAVISYDSTKVKPGTIAQTINELGYQAIN